MSDQAYVHPSAEIAESVVVKSGTKIWHLVQLRSGVQIGMNCILGRDVYIDENVVVGDNVKIQNRASIYKDCVIEDGVFIGPHVVFTNDMNPRAINVDGSLKAGEDWHAGTTRVKYGAAIGAGSIILPSRRIGRFALIGAGSVVTHDVPDHALVMGNPARHVGYVCKCGQRLSDSAGGTWKCLECDIQYVFSEDGQLNIVK